MFVVQLFKTIMKMVFFQNPFPKASHHPQTLLFSALNPQMQSVASLMLSLQL